MEFQQAYYVAVRSVNDLMVTYINHIGTNNNITFQNSDYLFFAVLHLNVNDDLDFILLVNKYTNIGYYSFEFKFLPGLQYDIIVNAIKYAFEEFEITDDIPDEIRTCEPTDHTTDEIKNKWSELINLILINGDNHNYTAVKNNTCVVWNKKLSS